MPYLRYDTALILFFKRYEIWEDETVAKISQDLSVRPKWDGMFCALDMKYVGAGLGSLLSDGMYDVAASQSRTGVQMNGKANRDEGRCNGEVYKQSYSSKRSQITFVSDKYIDRVSDRKSDTDDALILAVSHNRLSAEFYVKIGFKIIAMQPYYEDIVDEPRETQTAENNPKTDRKKLFNVYFLMK